jgi:hypothetical protein
MTAQVKLMKEIAEIVEMMEIAVIAEMIRECYLKTWVGLSRLF